MTLSTNPKDRMGVYKSLDQVPDNLRLKNYNSRYSGRESWEEFLDYYMNRRSSSESKRRRSERAWKSWCDFTTDNNPVLATPAAVERWTKSLIDEYQASYALKGYWAIIERFYTWMMMHVDYPHTYQPFWMAAAEYEATKKIWELKLSRVRGDKLE